MTWEQLCKLGRGLPDVAEGIWFRTPALKVRGKAFARLKEDGKTVVFLTRGPGAIAGATGLRGSTPARMCLAGQGAEDPRSITG